MPFVALLALLACAPPDAPNAPALEPSPVAAAVPPPIDADDPTTCAPCHGTVVQEWSGTMHASAHHDNDPIYGSMRELRMAKQGEAMGAKCLVCHTPRAPNDPDSPAGRAGVSCATCHMAAAVDLAKGPGAMAITFATDPLMRSARDLAPGASPVHGTGPAAPHLADGTTMCLACHNATKTPTGAAACTTGPEHLASGSEASCTSCHMPTVEGPSGAVSPRSQHASHAFLGPHTAWTGDPTWLASAVDLAVTAEGRTLDITVHNTTSHGFPTGFPGRLAVVRVRGFAADGSVVYSNLGPSGLPEAPEARFDKVYLDAEGKPVAAPFSVTLGRDGRLPAGAQRGLKVELPDTATVGEVDLAFYLLPPKLAKGLGVADLPIAEPAVLLTERIALGGPTP